MPILMSAMVKMPLARARSPNPRTADQYIFLHLAAQKRCGEPPRRARNGCSHHPHDFENPSAICKAVSARHIVVANVILKQSSNSKQ
jgi:hypothetical protein